MLLQAQRIGSNERCSEGQIVVGRFAKAEIESRLGTPVFCLFLSTLSYSSKIYIIRGFLHPWKKRSDML